MKTGETEKKITEEIQIPEGIETKIEDGNIIMRKDDKEIIRKINRIINVKIQNNKVIVEAKKMTKKDKKMFGTMKAHIKNMINGLTEGFEYKLQVSNVHFPMNINYNKENNELVVKNFLGEKKDRRIKLSKNVEVKVDKDIITIKSFDIEKAGQTATNIEKGTKVRNRDRRIFQDGIFIIEKPGRNYL